MTYAILGLCTTFAILIIWAYAAHRAELVRYRYWVERYEHRRHMEAAVEQATFENWVVEYRGRNDRSARQSYLVQLADFYNHQPTEQLEAHVKRLLGRKGEKI